MRLQGENIEPIQCDILKNGLYIISVEGGNQRFISKIVIINKIFKVLKNEKILFKYSALATIVTTFA